MKDKYIDGLISEAGKYVIGDCDKIVGKYIENELKKIYPTHLISGFDAWEGYVGTDNWEQGYVIQKTELKPFNIFKFHLWDDSIDSRILKIRSGHVKEGLTSTKQLLFTFYDRAYERDLLTIIESATKLSGLGVLYNYHYTLSD